MRFIEKIFGKKQSNIETTPVKLQFSKLPELIREEREKELGLLRPQIGEKYAEINAAVKQVGGVKKSLLEAEALADASKKMEKAGDSNRDNVAHNLDLVTGKIRVPSGREPRDALEFYRDARSVLKTALDNTRRSQLYIKALYPREFENIVLSLANLEKHLEELHALLEDKRKRTEAFEKLPEQVENIHQQMRIAEQYHERMADLESKYEAVQKELAATTAGIEGLEGSRDFERARDLEERIRALEEKVSAVDAEISRLFTPMSKALSRMEKQDKNEMYVLSPENRKLIGMIKDEPASIRENELGQFLDMLKKRIDNRDLGLKDQMYDKILRQIEKLRDPSTMSGLRAQRERYVSEIETHREELSRLDVYRERENLGKQVAQHKASASLLLSELDAERKELEETEGKLGEARKMLNSQIKDIFGMDAEIIYDT
ncbi:MAG: hypothetical protein PWR29_953 [Methanolobus sp.]|jgi:hypothetical protein|nr:hypothetical protein [Methanolobus sp.]MDK2834466.1 hypothetical protein [Methanolobus sp.]MDK2911996.1 hypothetical protein [Methanolobus sp.]MDN5308828.1 hypothetical protein [Methanolobus sp.]